MNLQPNFYQLSDRDFNKAVWPRTVEKSINLKKGLVPFTVFSIERGSKWLDILSTGFAGIYLYSKKIKTIVENNKLTGCTFIPVIIRLKNGKVSSEYYFLSVHGSCGEIDNSLSEKVEVIYESGHKEYQYKGQLFNLDTWDGSDIFSPSNYTSTIITEKTKNIFKENELTNILYEDINSIMRVILDK